MQFDLPRRSAVKMTRLSILDFSDEQTLREKASFCGSQVIPSISVPQFIHL